jgi:hypothetical protein
MSYGRRVKFAPIRSVAFGSITSNFVELGDPLGVHARIVAFNNDTDAHISLSFDNVDESLRLAPHSFKLLDLTANQVPEEVFFLARRTQVYIKYTSLAPTEGDFWMELVSADGDT